MAEVAALRAVINQSAEIGANLIVETGSRLYRLKENIEWIERKMRHFKSCLIDAESKKDRRKEVGNLINDMRDLALDIEDILDTYIPEIASHEGNGPFQCVKCAACGLCYGATANSFALEIEKIKRRAQEIEAARERCKVNAETERDGDMDVWDRRKKFLDAPDSVVVGREDILQELKNKLSISNSECKVICVVGEAGVGKTTIGKKIYREMLNDFTASAIVYVSNEPRVEELLLDIAKQVRLEEEKIKENLEVNLRTRLNEKKCLIFLDDIWKIEVWVELKKVIPFNSGSRTIVTSRYTDVGRYIGGEDESSLIELKLLDKEKSWELFSKLIKSSSENTNERFPSIELEDIARKIIEKCGGLPLAIEVAVGMLRQRRRSEYAWNEVLDSLSTSAENNCSKILSLSYKDLPPDLRPFFLYIGLFPKDQEIFAFELVNAWVTEKLIQVNGTRNPDDIVADKLEMLSDRNLIQVCKRNLDGRVKSCRIHDLLHVLCIEIAREINFFGTCHNINSNSFSTLRRLTIDTTSQYSFSNSKTPKLRTLLCFSNPGEEYSLVPNDIGNLSSLTYLKLSGIFQRMPSSIRNLKKLVTLDIKRATFRVFPSNIFRMKYLKHLFFTPPYGNFPNNHTNLYVGNDLYLPNIETLYGFPGNNFKANSLQKLSNLRKLNLFWTSLQLIDVISGTTPISENLQDLRLSIIEEFTMLNLSKYEHLAKLHFSETRFPFMLDKVEFPPNLINLTFENREFIEDPMKVLKELPRLEILRLKNCKYINYSLDLSGENSFPELQVLAIEGIDTPDLIVDQTGMPKLYKFVCNSDFLDVPERLRKMMVVTGEAVDVRLVLKSDSFVSPKNGGLSRCWCSSINIRVLSHVHKRCRCLT